MMKLPALDAGARICFQCEKIRPNRLRVNIGTGNKTVIYDWTPQSDEQDVNALHFALYFVCPGWKILVE